MSAIDKYKDGFDSTAYWAQRTADDLAGDASRKHNQITGISRSVQEWLRHNLEGVARARGERPAVLEMGCGFGRWAKALEGVYASYTGRDPSPERIAYACGEGYANSTFEICDPAQPWDARQYDAIFTVTVLQHLPMCEAVTFIRRAIAHLRPEGRILLAEWRFFDLPREMLDEFYLHPLHEKHMIPKPLGELRALLPAGWSLVGGEGRYAILSPAAVPGVPA